MRYCNIPLIMAVVVWVRDVVANKQPAAVLLRVLLLNLLPETSVKYKERIG